MVDISELKGKTIGKIEQGKGEFWDKGSKVNELAFHVGQDIYYMFHSQDCCEDVYIEEIIGDLDDLIGWPILEAEMVEGETEKAPDGYDDQKWTFYKLGTIKGHVTIRWYGTSNGYYSIDVSFQKNTKAWCYDE